MDNTNEMQNIQTWECGANNKADVIATLKGTTLTIEGKGKMADFEDDEENRAPWYNENFTTVIIEQGVTNIGDESFRDCLGLTFVVIANSVVSIGCGAFSGCTALEIFIIPENVRKIGDNAFRDCCTLKSITIPKSLRFFGNSLFYGCYSLETIINKSVTPQKIANDIEPFWYTKNYHGFKKHLYHNDDCKLYVPISSIKAYNTAPTWGPFKSILPIETFLEKEDLIEENTPEQIDASIEKFTEEIQKIGQQIEDLRFKKAMMRGLKGNPKQVAEFMSLFNQSDGLKYLTHGMDGSEFDYNEVLTHAKKVCTNNLESLEIPKSLRELLNQFIFEENPKWKSFDNQFNPIEIETGWSASDWQEAGNDLHPIKNTNTGNVINDFKRTTRIESPNLERLINKVFDNDDSFDIEKKDLSKADFYTHVGEFKSALDTIFEEIKKRGNMNGEKKVSISYDKETSGDFFVRKIIITHHNSFPTRNDKDALVKEWLSFEKGNMAKIAEHLQGYCHWSVETRIDNEPIRVNILREKETEPSEAIEASDADGFTHILTFYYQS